MRALSLRAALRLALVFGGLAAFAFLGGCAKAKGTLGPNVPPETFLFVQGKVDTVNHTVHLFWYGSDIDGAVSAFEIRMFNSFVPGDSNWKSIPVGERSAFDSLFTVYTPTGFDSLRFEVRSIDNDGARDESPAFLDFSVSNQAPVVNFNAYPGLADSTYPSLTIAWTANDPDGDGTKMKFHIWLDGNAANLDSTNARVFTIPSGRFLQAGTFTSGYRTVYVQAIDDGGRFGPIDSTRWYVRAPAQNLTNNKGRVLLIDDVLSDWGNNLTIDTLYANTLARNLPAGSFSVLKLEFTQPFRSVADVAQTFRLFDAVVWYRADQPPYSGVTIPAGTQLLESYQDSIGAYVDNSGRFYLECMNAVQGPEPSGDDNSHGPLRASFMQQYLGADSMRTYFNSSLQESAVAWGNRSNSRFRSSLFSDTLRATTILQTVGVRGFALRDTANAALWALPDQLAPLNPEQLAVAVMIRQPGGGRVCLTTYPIRFGVPAGGSRMLARLLFHATNGLMAP